MRRKNNTALILGGLVVGVMLCELVLRATGISYPIFSQIDAELGASLRPGVEGWYTREGHAYVRINSAGLRDREHISSKPPHTVRIAVLGDSFAEAVQVPMEDTFWSVLEREIKGCPTFGGRDPEVINFGVSGYGTAQELLMLRHRVWPYSPDVVLLTFVTGNDIRNNSRTLEHGDTKPYFVRKNGQLVADLTFRDSWAFRLRQTQPGRWISPALNSLRTYQVLSEVRRLAKARASRSDRYNIGIESASAANADGDHAVTPWDGHPEAGLDATVYREPQDPDWKEAWEVTEELVVLMRDEARAKGAEFLVVTMSNGPQVYPYPKFRGVFEQRLGVAHLFYPDFRIRDLGKQHGFSVLNLAPLFQRYAQEHQVYLHGFENSGVGMGHWNTEGHRLAGQLIAQKLCSDYR